MGCSDTPLFMQTIATSCHRVTAKLSYRILPVPTLTKTAKFMANAELVSILVHHLYASIDTWHL